MSKKRKQSKRPKLGPPERRAAFTRHIKQSERVRPAFHFPGIERPPADVNEE